MGQARSLRCRLCRKPIVPAVAGATSFVPFCSERCKMVDLGRWLGGEYRIPGEDLASMDPSELSRLERDALDASPDVDRDD